MRIRIEYIGPPIPARSHDWIAYDDKTYSGEESDIVGYGATELEALKDLLSRLEEENAEDDK